MEGHINENPLAELIREISVKRLSGRLRVQQERIAVAVYFKDGVLIYAASNVRLLRLREYLIKNHLVSEEAIARFDSRQSDISLARELTNEGLLNESQSSQTQLRLVADVLRLALLWTEGTWEFDARSHLSEEVPFKLNWEQLVLDAGRRISTEFAASRLSNAAEILSPVASPTERNDLQPTEVFLLSRLDQPTSISDLTILSGLPEGQTLRLIYALALSGLIQREQWKQAIHADVQTKPAPVAAASAPSAEPAAQTAESEAESLQRFLERIDSASTHYEVLAVSKNVTTAVIKKSYYEFARRYHPDRFRKEGDAALNARIEDAFARVTQAYETLCDAGPRATYDSKLDAQRRAQSGGESAKTTSASRGKSAEAARSANEPLTDADRAEEHFKEGFAAQQMGQVNTAIGMFSAAARLAPNDARFRAYYGQALATHAGTRRLAEAELQAAVKLDPENGDYRTMLAELYRDLGFAVRARSEVEKVLKVVPDHQKARELLRSLRS